MHTMQLDSLHLIQNISITSVTLVVRKKRKQASWVPASCRCRESKRVKPQRCASPSSASFPPRPSSLPRTPRPPPHAAHPHPPHRRCLKMLTHGWTTAKEAYHLAIKNYSIIWRTDGDAPLSFSNLKWKHLNFLHFESNIQEPHLNFWCAVHMHI